MRPGSSAATIEYFHPKNQLRLVLPPAVDVAERSLWARRGVRAQPGADIDRENDPAVAVTRKRQPTESAAQSCEIYSAAVDCVVQTAVAASVFGGQGQLDQAADCAACAQQCIGQLEQAVTAGRQRAVELFAERHQGDTRIGGRSFPGHPLFGHTDAHGHRPVRLESSVEGTSR